MSAPAGYVEALWVGSYEAEVPGGAILTPGVSTLVIPEGEAIESDNWRVVPPPVLKSKENTD